MTKSRKKPKTMTPQDILWEAFWDACRQKGFCSAPLVKLQELVGRERLTACEFAEEIITAEGLVPAYEKKHMRELMRCFERRVGASEILLR
jgi:hypothetical protein